MQAPPTLNLRPTPRVLRLVPSQPRCRRRVARRPKLRGKKEPLSPLDWGSRRTPSPSVTRLAATRRRGMPTLWRRRHRLPSLRDGLPGPLVFAPSRSRRRRRRRSESARQRGSRRSNSSRRNSSSRRRRNSSGREGKTGDRSSPHLKVRHNPFHRRRKNPENTKRICQFMALQPQRGSFRGRLPRSGQSQDGRTVWWRSPV